MIELGLSRITRLLKDTPIPWRAIHVAGTNGKGSVCAYASAILYAGNVRCGRYTSPHLIDRWDCITINEKTVNENLFHEVEALVKARDMERNIKASEFEILTATAFEIFSREKIDVGIVEVGLGGRNDATNILPSPAVTVITKIGKDHQAFLGNTLEEIAYQKAGIMKGGVPCVIDGSNLPCVIEVLRLNSEEVNVSSLSIVYQDTGETDYIWTVLPRENFEIHQRMNICLAFHAIKEVLPNFGPLFDPQILLSTLRQLVWPGRLQTLSVEALVGTKQDVLLDGAHNAQSAEVLGAYVDRKLRHQDQSVTWILALSRGKDATEVFSQLIRRYDKIVAVAFGPVDGMPWIKPEERERLFAGIRSLDIDDLTICAEEQLLIGIQRAVQLANGGPIVIAGSLYLVSDVLRLLRNI